MKKLFILALLAVFMGSGAQLFAKESEFFAKTIYVNKVTAHQKGYRVSYWLANNTLHTIYIPIQWFDKLSPYNNDDGFTKAEFVYGVGEAYPFMQVFWKSGKFHHIRLFVNKDYHNPSWGVLGDHDDIGKFFDPNGTIEFKF